MASGTYKSELEKRASFNRRLNEAVKLVMVKADGFTKSKTPLTFGNKAGRETLVAQVFYTDAPIKGVVYWKDDKTYLFPSQANEVDSSVSTGRGSQAVYGFNLNFFAGKLRGIQPIFGNLDSGQIDSSSVSLGQWLGKTPGDATPKTVNGNGKPVHGFLLFKKGDDVMGFQLVTEK